MKILVFSDSHGERELMKSLIIAQNPDMVLHLGDYIADMTAIKGQFKAIDIRGVRGNCDGKTNAADSLYFNIEGKNIFMTHGHDYQVKIGYKRIFTAASEKNADILLFGHTHKALRDMAGGIQILNPGSIGKGRRRSYGIIEIDCGDIKTQIQTA
ncbi:MAG: metallophosphoesterase [Clostridiales bacterium]|jgi:putative phosphoesterase|nr:metallophosphoesterase [Clostridiales bacterium]